MNVAEGAYKRAVGGLPPTIDGPRGRCRDGARTRAANRGRPAPADGRAARMMQTACSTMPVTRGQKRRRSGASADSPGRQSKRRGTSEPWRRRPARPSVRRQTQPARPLGLSTTRSMRSKPCRAPAFELALRYLRHRRVDAGRSGRGSAPPGRQRPEARREPLDHVHLRLARIARPTRGSGHQ